MAVERTNPLPAGRYWVTVIGAAKIRAFDSWLRHYRDDLMAVKVLSTSLDSGGWQRQPSQFIAFEVTRDGVADWQGPGLPTIVPAGAPVPSRSSTVRRPDPPSSGVDLSFLEGPGALVLLLLYLYSKGRKKR